MAFEALTETDTQFGRSSIRIAGLPFSHAWILARQRTMRKITRSLFP